MLGDAEQARPVGDRGPFSLAHERMDLTTADASSTN